MLSLIDDESEIAQNDFKLMNEYLLLNVQKQLRELFCKKSCFKKLCKIHRKTPFNKVSDLRYAMYRERNWNIIIARMSKIHDMAYVTGQDHTVQTLM